jgi:hypothetical protein
MRSTSVGLYSFGETPARRPVIPFALTARKLIEASLDVRAELLALLVALLEEPQRFAHNLTRGLVKTALDFFADELFEFGGERNVHVEIIPRTHAKDDVDCCQDLTSVHSHLRALPSATIGASISPQKRPQIRPRDFENRAISMRFNVYRSLDRLPCENDV